MQLYPQPSYLTLEAAHIKAVSCEGPDKISNGLSLCSNHHAFFDSGAFTISPHSNKFYIEVSDRIVFKGKDMWLSPYDMNQLYVPDKAIDKPGLEFIEWHRENVFVT